MATTDITTVISKYINIQLIRMCTIVTCVCSILLAFLQKKYGHLIQKEEQ